MAYKRCSTQNSNALMMASVSGSFSRNVVPWPGRVSTLIVAFQALQNALHHVHAHAASGDFGDFFGGAEPGPKMNADFRLR